MNNELIKQEKILDKIYTVVGDEGTDIILNSKGNVKVRFGNSFLNLIKNGKISSESFSQTTSSGIIEIYDKSEIISDGIYFTKSDKKFYISIGGIIFELNTKESEDENNIPEDDIEYTEDSYLSIKNRQRLTSDQLEIVLNNTKQVIEYITDNIHDIPNNYPVYVNSNGKHYKKENEGLTELYLSLEDGGIVKGVVNIGETNIPYPKSKLNIIGDSPVTLFDGNNSSLKIEFNRNNIILIPNNSTETRFVINTSGLGINIIPENSLEVLGNQVIQGILNVLHPGRIITEDIGSNIFFPGFTGEGFRIYRDSEGRYCAEFDNLTVRQTMRIYELILEKIRVVKGSMVISQGGSVVTEVLETVLTTPKLDAEYNPTEEIITVECYKLVFKDEYIPFLPNDLVRCQVFQRPNVRGYWVWVREVDGNSIFVDKTEFGGIYNIPEVGDEVCHFGNVVDKSRQSVIYLTASDTINPVIDILSDLNKKSFSGSTRCRLGNLNGIVYNGEILDGYGLFGDNVYLKGKLITWGNDVNNPFDVGNDLERSRLDIDKLNITAEELQKQIDGQLEFYSGSEIPTLNNYPAVDWTTSHMRESHKNDRYNRLFYSEDRKEDVTQTYTFLYNGTLDTYEWKLIANSDTVKLEQELQEYLGILGEKIKLIYSDYLPTPPYEINDIWINAGNVDVSKKGNIYICINPKVYGQPGNQSDWLLVNSSQSRLAAMTDDNIITREEKKKFRQELSKITNEYSHAITNNSNNISTAKIDAAYNAIKLFLLNIFKIEEDSDTSVTNTQIIEFNTKYADWTNALFDFSNSFSVSLTEGAKEGIANSLGYESYSNLVEEAQRGKTLIQGGYINTKLLEADIIIGKIKIDSPWMSSSKLEIYEDDGRINPSWRMDSTAITGGINTTYTDGVVKFLPDGTMFGFKNNNKNLNPWRFNSDGSGSVGFGALSWVPNGTITFGSMYQSALQTEIEKYQSITTEISDTFFAVATDYNGEGGVYNNIYVRFWVYKGTTNITNQCSMSVSVSNSNVKYSSSIQSTGEYLINLKNETSGYPYPDSFTLEISSTYKGTSLPIKRFRVNKLKGESPDTPFDPVYYSVAVTKNTCYRSELLGDAIIASAYKYTIDGESYSFPCYWSVYYDTLDGSNLYLKHTYSKISSITVDFLNNNLVKNGNKIKFYAHIDSPYESINPNNIKKVIGTDIVDILEDTLSIKTTSTQPPVIGNIGDIFTQINSLGTPMTVYTCKSTYDYGDSILNSYYNLTTNRVSVDPPTSGSVDDKFLKLNTSGNPQGLYRCKLAYTSGATDILNKYWELVTSSFNTIGLSPLVSEIVGNNYVKKNIIKDVLGLYTCKTKYNVSDTIIQNYWVLTGDMTQSTLNNGLFTTGTIHLGQPSSTGGSETTILAGITGSGNYSDPNVVRIWSGGTIGAANNTVLNDLNGSSLTPTASFVVTQGGKLYANNAMISGKITADEGYIADFKITKDALEATGSGGEYLRLSSRKIKFGDNYDSAELGIRAGGFSNTLLSIQSGDFIHQTGEFLTSNVRFRGDITYGIYRGEHVENDIVNLGKVMQWSVINFTIGGNSTVDLWAPIASNMQTNRQYLVLGTLYSQNNDLPDASSVSWCVYNTQKEGFHFYARKYNSDTAYMMFYYTIVYMQIN